ncbi:MAG: four helix bundle protein [Calditrichaeota bacterium]|nr:MAG: four helix bundle protein [Calditrichota bacterium]
MRDHTKLRAFVLADELLLKIYQITKKFPREEQFGLTSQMRRAAVSVLSNIVEGCARESLAEYCRFLEIAFASLRELHYQVSLATRMEYLNENPDVLPNLNINEVEKVLGSLLRAVRKIRPTA